MRSPVCLCLEHRQNFYLCIFKTSCCCVYSRQTIVQLTQHFADIGLNVDILEVLVGVSVEEPEGGVESDGHPDTVAIPGQQTYLTVFTRVGIK